MLYILIPAYCLPARRSSEYRPKGGTPRAPSQSAQSQVYSIQRNTHGSIIQSRSRSRSFWSRFRALDRDGKNRDFLSRRLNLENSCEISKFSFYTILVRLSNCPTRGTGVTGVPFRAYPGSPDDLFSLTPDAAQWLKTLDINLWHTWYIFDLFVIFFMPFD